MAATPPAALPRPGVQIIQEVATPTASFAIPTLIPCVVGTAYEVTNVLNSDGSLNAGDKYGAYTQAALVITESSFPAPRNNIDELVIQPDTVKPYLLAGGQLGALPLSPYGSSFLVGAATDPALGCASQPSMRTIAFNGGTGLPLVGTTLVIAVDQIVRLNTADDIVITFTGSGNLTSAQAAAQINAIVGQTVATVVGSAPNDQVQLGSTNYGATSSITIRAGGSANSVLHIGFASSSAAHEERVEGAGWRGQDQNNGTTQTPYIEFYQGAYLLDGTSTSFPAITTGAKSAEEKNLITGAYVSAVAPAVTFGSSGGQIPILAGDQFYADGTDIGGSFISVVQSARFKLGTIDTTLSVVNDLGQYVTTVYDTYTVGTILDPNPFAPKYDFFIANNLNWLTATPEPTVLTAANAATAATAAIVTGTGAGAGPFALAGLNLQYTVTIDGVATEGTFTFTGGPFANMAAVVTAIGTNIPDVAATASGASPPQLILTTTATGQNTSIQLAANGTANSYLGFSTVDVTEASGTDPTLSGLAATSLAFSFDGNPHVYVAAFNDNSLLDAITEINTVVGSTVASLDESGLLLVLTSPLAGIASSISVPMTDAGADTIFGNSTSPTLFSAAVYTDGTGRPLPNAYLDEAQVLHIGAEILRDTVTGAPLDQAQNNGSLYIQYQALRLDVTAVAANAGVLNITSSTTLSTILNPLTNQNPLGLGLFLCSLNAPTYTVMGLGIDEISGGQPYGTTAAWARAAALLEAQELYALAPLTQDQTVFGLMQSHVDTMSEPEQGGERIVFINPVIPTNANPTIALAGNEGNSTNVQNTFLADGNPAPGLIAAGIPTPLTSIAQDENVYVTFTLNGQPVNFNVAGVNGALITLRTTFTDGFNANGFYQTTPLTSQVIDAPYSLNVLGAPLTIPGSNPPLPDYTAISNTIGEANEGYDDRRVYSVFPDTVQVVVNGITMNLPGFYACAAVAGMCGAQPPQQGFTNFPITGVVGVVGTSNYTKSQLDVMAGGGTYILIQDVQNGPVYSRHQLSTDLSSIETRELSITRVVDFTAKFLRAAVRKFIGVNVINQNLLDALGTTISAVLAFLESTGVLNGSTLNQIIQDASAPDTVLGSITLDVPYPCNYIMLTLAF
jgi:hypothetical protein